MTPARRFATYAVQAAYILSAIYVVWLGFTQPYMNWDIVTYTGTVLSWKYKDAQTLYTATAELLKAELPDWVYKQVWLDSELTQNAKAFAQQLPFYTVKPLYTGSMGLLHKLGATLTASSWIISALSMAGLLALMLFLPPKRLHLIWLPGIAALLWLGPWPMADLARFSTPDALSLFLVMAAAASWLRWKNWLLLALLGMLATLARPDCMLLVAMLGFASLLPLAGSYRLKPWQGVIVIGAAITTYIASNLLMGGYGWEKLFVYNFLEKTPYPADATRRITLHDYMGTLTWNLQLMMKEGRFWCFVALSATAIAAYVKKPECDRIWPVLLGLCWAAYAARFLMFPAAQEYRYYYGFYLLMLWAASAMIMPWLESRFKK